MFLTKQRFLRNICRSAKDKKDEQEIRGKIRGVIWVEGFREKMREGVIGVEEFRKEIEKKTVESRRPKTG